MEKIDSLQFRSIFDEELHVLIDVFKKHNYDLRIAGYLKLTLKLYFKLTTMN